MLPSGTIPCVMERGSSLDELVDMERLDGIRWYELHRWLNPFARQRSQVTTSLVPGEVENTIRPFLFSYRWSHLPYKGLHGSLESWGFLLKREMFQQPRLKAKYHEHDAVTDLDLEFGRSRWGIFGWLWNMTVWPIISFIYIVELFSAGVLGPPDWIDFNALWQSGDPLAQQQYAIRLCIVIFGISQMVATIVNSYRRRFDLAFYETFLSDVINARETEEAA